MVITITQIAMGIISNLLTDIIKLSFNNRIQNCKDNPAAPHINVESMVPIVDENLISKRMNENGIPTFLFKPKYHTFDTTNDFVGLLETLDIPILHIVIEDQNYDSAWHLPVIVLEEKRTGQWYVFNKGRIALEGSGGGIRNFEELLHICAPKNILASLWVLDYYNSEKLSQGCAFWPEIKKLCIPLLAYNGSKAFVYIRDNFLTIQKKSYAEIANRPTTAPDMTNVAASGVASGWREPVR